jgi:hypothetical protein
VELNEEGKIDVTLPRQLQWCLFQGECRGDDTLTSPQRHQVTLPQHRCDSVEVEYHLQLENEVWTLAPSTSRSTEGRCVETMR